MSDLLAPLLAPLAILAGIVAVWLRARYTGARDERDKAKARDAKAYTDTKDRMQDATLGDNPSPDALRERMRNRNTDQR